MRRRWQEVTPSDEVEAADWIRERLHPFAQDVGAIVPPGFAAYARIFHPAWKQAPDRSSLPLEVRWSEVAGWNGKTVHPEMQFHSIGGPSYGARQALGPPVQEPRLGVLSERQGAALVRELSRHTATPAACWLCLWDGYGDLYSGGSYSFMFQATRNPRRRPKAPPAGPRQIAQPTYPQRDKVRLPYRDYLLFKGSVAEAQGWMHGPNLWWPEDRAWCVASEIDFAYTYVGASIEVIEEIIQDPELEALPARLTDGVTATSDKINS